MISIVIVPLLSLPLQTIPGAIPGVLVTFCWVSLQNFSRFSQASLYANPTCPTHTHTHTHKYCFKLLMCNVRFYSIKIFLPFKSPLVSVLWPCCRAFVPGAMGYLAHPAFQSSLRPGRDGLDCEVSALWCTLGANLIPDSALALDPAQSVPTTERYGEI